MEILIGGDKGICFGIICEFLPDGRLFSAKLNIGEHYITQEVDGILKEGQNKWCIVFRKIKMMVTMSPNIIKMNISLSGEIMTVVFTMNRMIITMEILVGFVGQMITENPGCSSAWSKILDCFPGALNILNQFAGTVQRTFEYKMYYSDQSSYQLFWPAR